jgi:hypothetical protein
VNKSNFAEWLQRAVAVSVLAGVLLVAWELTQNNKLAGYERIADVNQMWTGIYDFEHENDVWLLYKKSIENPQDLTDRELLTLDNWLNRLMDVLVLNAMQNRVHGIGRGPEAQIDVYAGYYFGSQFSRAWLIDAKDWYMEDSPELTEKLIEEFRKTPAVTEYEQLEQLRSFSKTST